MSHPQDDDPPTSIDQQVADAYDDLNRRFALPFVDDLSGKPLDRELLSRFLDLCQPGRLCDLGSGTGKIARFLADRGAQVCGLDLSGEAIAQARRLHPEIAFHLASFTQTPFGAATFTGLTSFFAIIHLPRHRAPEAFEEMRRISRPGAHLLLACYEGEGEIVWARASGSPIDITTTRFTSEAIEGLADGAGYEVLDVFSRGPYEHEYDCQRLFLLARLRG